ncbi:MAG TPA: acetyl-CoA carboxylase biotin carboxyl carrier protein subunit, partial [Terriglobales bacterium]|nr:acetyl-CoA carboxylase biotin carboxyl carrier protein subunit [Terriglobales bacterium]
LGQSELREQPRFPEAEADSVQGGCQAPMPGKILALRVAVGDAVRRGQCLVILEAMKMEHEVCAPEDGVIAEVRAEAGQQVSAGQVLVVIAPAENEPGEDR